MASTEGWISLIDGSQRGIAPALLRRSLWFARLPYAIGVGIRNKLFDMGWKQQKRASIPVISIGNLTLGGTGKTPCVEFVARFLNDQGYAAAILSRGYGSQGGAMMKHSSSKITSLMFPTCKVRTALNSPLPRWRNWRAKWWSWMMAFSIAGLHATSM